MEQPLILANDETKFYQVVVFKDNGRIDVRNFDTRAELVEYCHTHLNRDISETKEQEVTE